MSENKRIGLREVRELPQKTTLYDISVPGFAARRQLSSPITFLVRYRTADGRQRWHTIGRWGPLTPDQARERARQILHDVSKGLDPAAEKKQRREAPTMSQLCDEYLAVAKAGRLLGRGGKAKRASTLESDVGRLRRHVVPLLGSRKVAAVTTHEIERFMHDVADGKTAARSPTGRKRGLSNVRGGRGVAARTVSLLSGVFTYAIRQGMRSDNPVRGVVKYADQKRDRRLSDEEYASLGRILRRSADGGKSSPASPASSAVSGAYPSVTMAIRMLALTGWRASEALTLTWSDVDLGKRTAILPTTKTGRSIRPLAYPVVDLLCGMPKIGERGLVFPSARDGVMTGFRSSWDRVMKRAGLPTDITPHTLRHSFASVAGDLGLSELAIGALLGHAGNSVTASYIHAADAVVLAAADKVAASIAERMGDAIETGVVVPLRGTA